MSWKLKYYINNLKLLLDQAQVQVQVTIPLSTNVPYVFYIFAVSLNRLFFKPELGLSQVNLKTLFNLNGQRWPGLQGGLQGGTKRASRGLPGDLQFNFKGTPNLQLSNLIQVI